MQAHGMKGGEHGRALSVSAVLTGAYFVIELAVGLYTGSVAVISDAFHTFSAVGGVLVAIVAARIARRPATSRQTFGAYRAEIIGALVNGAFLLIMALLVLWMGALRLRAPTELAVGPMLWVAAGGLITEVVSIGLLFRGQRSDLNVRGAFWHVLQTFVGSLIIIVAALVIHFTGFLAIDPLLGMAFGVVLLWASWGIMKEATLILMETTPPELELERLIAALEALPNVLDVHHVHAWQLTSGRAIFSGHLRVREHDAGGKTLQAAHALVNAHGVHFATLQLETHCLDEADAADLDFTRDRRSN